MELKTTEKQREIYHRVYRRDIPGVLSQNVLSDVFDDFITLQAEIADLMNKERALMYAIDDLRYSLDSQERCNQSLRDELSRQSTLQKERGEYIDLLRKENTALHTDLTIAKQDTANALHELRSAAGVIDYAAVCITHKERRISHDNCREWLTLHAQQTKAPLVDPEVAQLREELARKNAVLETAAIIIDSALDDIAAAEQEYGTPPGGSSYPRAQAWLDALTPPAMPVLPDPEAEAEQAKEAMLEDR